MMADAPPDEDVVRLVLTRDEAVVLLDWLLRFNARSDGPFDDVAEKYVLWGTECMLEQQLSEPFHPDYPQLVEQARQRVRDSY